MGRPRWMLRDGSPSAQKSVWSTAIYWSSKLVQSIQKKRRGETTLGEKIAYLRSLKSGTASYTQTVIGQILYVDAACTHRARWREMHFSLGGRWKSSVLFPWDCHECNEKTSRGKKKEKKNQWRGWLGWDMRWGNGAWPARCDWVVWGRWTFHNCSSQNKSGLSVLHTDLFI